MAADPARFLTDCYRRHGPVFRVRLLSREYPVIAGAEAALFLGSDQGRENLRSREFWQGLADEFGAGRTLVGEDGASHAELRDLMRRGYSRAAVEGRLGELVTITDRHIDRVWRPGTAVPVLAAMQRLVTDQLGDLVAGAARPEYVADIRLFTRWLLNALVIRQWPRVLLRDPRYRHAKARVVELSHRIVDDRSAGLGGPAPLVDDLLRAHRDDPGRMPAGDLAAALIGPFVAGLDTVANTTAAFVYAVLKHPEVHQRVVAEADRLFAGGDITDADLSDLPALRGALMETMRLYPIAVAQMRTATRDFTFEGHRIAAGETVLLGTSVPHFLPEHYPHPERFDIDRYSKPRVEHRQPGAYSPYGRGPHLCLGKALAEVQMLVTMGRLLHRCDLRLDPPGYTLARRSSPTPGPAPSFRVRVDGHRH